MASETNVTNMFSSYNFWIGSSLLTSAALVRLAPEYSIRDSYFWTAIVLFFSQWLVYGTYAIVIYPRFISPLRHLPSPPGGSFFNGQWWAITMESSGVPMRRWVNEVPNDGLIRYLHLFNRERLLLTSPKALAEVLTTNSYDFVKPRLLREGAGAILGSGILFAEGDEHKHQRKAFMPAFNFRQIKELYPIFWAKSREMVHGIEAQLAAQSPSLAVDVSQWISRATLDIIGLAGMGQDFNSLADPNTELNSVYRKIFQPSKASQVISLLQFFIPFWMLRLLPLQRNDDIMAASAVARNTARKLVQSKREALAAKRDLSPDIISVALESGSFTEDELVNNMMTFLAAGHETTASAFVWAIYLLCLHPAVQTKLRQEIRSHIPGGLASEIDHTVLDNMPYLHAVCSETLRLYAPVPLTLRDTAVDTTILGQFVPKGTKIILSPWAVNTSTYLWGPDSADFNPERWLAPGQAGSGGASSNYAFLTFLHGPRSCIGQRFAVAELGALVAAFVGWAEVELVDREEKIVTRGGLTARPRDGLRVVVRGVGGW